MADDVDIEKLRALLDVLAENGIAEFEHEKEGTRIRIVRARAGGAPAAAASDPAPLAAAAVVSHAVAEPPSDTVDVTSPFVGTFYRASGPDTPSFAEVGMVVKAGQTLCIIEAMKLMNEIESELAGTVVEVLAQNGKAVEYGQKLFRIRKA